MGRPIKEGEGARPSFLLSGVLLFLMVLVSVLKPGFPGSRFVGFILVFGYHSFKALVVFVPQVSGLGHHPHLLPVRFYCNPEMGLSYFRFIMQG